MRVDDNTTVAGVVEKGDTCLEEQLGSGDRVA